MWLCDQARLVSGEFGGGDREGREPMCIVSMVLILREFVSTFVNKHAQYLYPHDVFVSVSDSWSSCRYPDTVRWMVKMLISGVYLSL
jgi:hypothetical protein